MRRTSEILTGLGPQPRLTATRVFLRPLCDTDLADLVAIAADRRIADSTISVPHPFTTATGREWIDNSKAGFRTGRQAGFAVDRTEDPGHVIGYVGLHHIDFEHLEAEISFWIGAAYEGRGYTTEAAERLIRYAFDELQMNRLCAFHMVRNPASGRILQKLRFQQEGCLRQRVRKWGIFEDVVVLSRLRSDPG